MTQAEIDETNKWWDEKLKEIKEEFKTSENLYNEMLEVFRRKGTGEENIFELLAIFYEVYHTINLVSGSAEQLKRAYNILNFMKTYRSAY